MQRHLVKAPFYLHSFTGVASVMFLSYVLDLLAKMNASMQKKTADFSRLKIFLDSVLDELKSLKDEKADWCSVTEVALKFILDNTAVDQLGLHS